MLLIESNIADAGPFIFGIKDGQQQIMVVIHILLSPITAVYQSKTVFFFILKHIPISL